MQRLNCYPLIILNAFFLYSRICKLANEPFMDTIYQHELTKNSKIGLKTLYLTAGVAFDEHFLSVTVRF